MALFKGAAVALVTPFKEDYSVDYSRLDEILDFQLEQGTDAIVVCGTTGEPVTMTTEEKLSVIKYTVDKINGRIPVIAGTGSNCTRTAIQLSQEAEEDGADGLLIVTPY